MARVCDTALHCILHQIPQFCCKHHSYLTQYWPIILLLLNMQAGAVLLVYQRDKWPWACTAPTTSHSLSRGMVQRTYTAHHTCTWGLLYWHLDSSWDVWNTWMHSEVWCIVVWSSLVLSDVVSCVLTAHLVRLAAAIMQWQWLTQPPLHRSVWMHWLCFSPSNSSPFLVLTMSWDTLHHIPLPTALQHI